MTASLHAYTNERREMSDYPSQPKMFGMGAAWWFAILALLAVTSAAVFGIRWLTAPARGKLQAREQIQSGDSRIQAYDHFFNLCASVQSIEGKLDAQYNERAAASGDDLRRINTNITGLTGARFDAVTQYNADAHKDYTIGQFRSSQLPFELPATYDYKKGVHTQCAV